jgi:hypothetical protein
MPTFQDQCGQTWLDANEASGHWLTPLNRCLKVLNACHQCWTQLTHIASGCGYLSGSGPFAKRLALRCITVLLSFLIGATASFADQASIQYYSVAPPPLGNDANDCVSAACATFQHAVNLCPSGGHCKIEVAPGSYSQKTSVVHYKVVTITGPISATGQCADTNGVVVVDDRTNGAMETSAIFWVQDHAILSIRCMTLRGYMEGSTGFAARQFAIGDVDDIDF